MRYLLDTHVFLWIVSDQRKLSARCVAVLQESKTELYLSAASVWEIGIKAGSGKLKLHKPLNQMLNEVEVTGLKQMPVTWEHASGVETLPAIHKDPFDRLLIAQAKLEALTVLTSDTVFKQYKVPVLW